MSNNTGNFDEEIEQVDAEFEEDTVAAEPGAKPPKPAKAGGGFGKFVVLLLVLGIGGALAAEHFGVIKLPVDIPGVTPAQVAAATPPADTPVPDSAAPGTPPGDIAAATPPADPAQTGLPPATGADATPPADPAAAAGSAMIPPAIGSQQPNATEIKAPGADPFADLPPATGATDTASATTATGTGTPSITPPATPSITPPATGDVMSAPAGTAITPPVMTAPADTAAATPADPTASGATADPLAGLSTPADSAASTTAASSDPLGMPPADTGATPIVAADPAVQSTAPAADPALQAKVEALESQVKKAEDDTAAAKAAADAKDQEIARLQAQLATARSANSNVAATSGDEPAAAPKARKQRRATAAQGSTPRVSIH
ncbi:MAG TPA: hypothetical protein VEF76_04210, partial [Patescibacteria group bacterium]|nr:hypothetical protein [Patescibacteria group bacterium]